MITDQVKNVKPISAQLRAKPGISGPGTQGMTAYHADVTIEGGMWTSAGTRKALVTEFKDFTAFLDYMDTDEEDKDAWYSASKSGRDGGFRYFHTFERSFKAAKFGWEEGTKRAKKVLSDMKLTHLMGFASTFNVSREPVGTVLNMGAYVSGDPNCFTQRNYVSDVTSEGGSKHVRINVNPATMAFVDAGTMMNRGVAALALALALEAAGYAVDIYATNISIIDSRHASIFEVPVKKAGQPINMDVVAYALANPDFNRRMKFRWMERLPSTYSDSGYGQSANPVESSELFNGPAEIYLPGLNTETKKTFGQIRNATRFVNQTLEQYI